MHKPLQQLAPSPCAGLCRSRLINTFLAAAVTLVVLAPPSAAQEVITRPKADEIARQKGWTIRRETADGGAIELQKIVDGIPYYYATQNRAAADSVSTDECWPGGSTGLNLNGAGVLLGVWDGGRVRTTHQEFGGRAIQRDGSPSLLTHSTHVSGTLIGAGLSPASGGHPAGLSKGMSFAATLDCYDFNSDTNEMSTAAAAGLLLSSHSYGLITGWRFDDLGAGVGWYWLGDVNVSTFEDYSFGFYSNESASWDEIGFEKPHYLIVRSAGNDRNEGPSPGTTHFVSINGNWVSSNAVRSLDGNGGYDSISHSGVSKNVLTIGAVNDIVGGYSGPASVVMSGFSAWGPADDGRIKPDVVGNGINLYSASSSSNNTYTDLSGTSMSTPNVAGSLGLLIQHYRATHSGEDMRAATLKGVVIHTADEAGPSTGPDYSFGWGLVNTPGAADVIGLDQSEPGAMQELVLTDGEFIEQTWTYSGSGPIRATACWTDPPATPLAPALDPTTSRLVNDLDLRIIGPATYEPWRLNRATPTAAATVGDNAVDNVEVVDVESPSAGDYVVRITHKGSLGGGFQRFSLILTGLTAGPAVSGACCVTDSCAGDLSEGDCATAGGEWYGGASCAALTCPSVGACCEGCPPSATCASKTLAQCDAADGRWTPDATCGEVSCGMPGDVCATDIQTVTDGVHAFDNRCATTDGPTPVACDNGSQPFGKDLWYAYTAPCTGPLSISLCDGTSFDAIMALYTNNTSTCPCPTNASLQLGQGTDDSCGVGGGPPQLTLNVVAGTCYTIRIAGWDSAAGTGEMVVSCDGEVCPISDAPTPEPAAVRKNRYLSFVPGNTGTSTAIRVRLNSLYDPNPPVPPGPPPVNFNAFEGQVRWVGAPADCTDSVSPATTFKCAPLQCTPHYMDWGSIATLSVYGQEVLPSSQYDVQTIYEECNPATSGFFSTTLPVSTARWGDVIAPFQSPSPASLSQPNFLDISGIVAKFTGAAGAPAKASAQLQPNALDPNAPISFLDVSACVAAFKGGGYPHAGPASCP